MNVEHRSGYEVVRLTADSGSPYAGEMVSMLSNDAETPHTLGVGEHHELDREKVRELISHLEAWLATGSLVLPPNC